MKTLDSFLTIKNTTPIIATIGMFDGVHLGHKALLTKIAQKAKDIGGKSLLISFTPHPRIVLFKDDSVELITTQDEKIAQLQSTGIDFYYPISFTKKFAQLSAYDFVKEFLVQPFNLHTLIIGHDHQFGKNREGTFAHLQTYSKEFAFNLEQISAINYKEENISSTKIRKALHNGDIKKANQMLGYNFHLNGTVVEGKKIGATLGFPTANINTEKYKLVPKNGVYVVEVIFQKNKYKGVLNIGTQPTFEAKTTQIEVHILDFDQNIYGENIAIHFVDFIREEQLFSSVAELQTQITKDCEVARKWFE